MCVDCGDRPSQGPGARCDACSHPPEPDAPPSRPGGQTVPPATGERCGRPLKSKAGRCVNGPTDWPEIPGEPAPVPVCWTHLTPHERANCTRAKEIRAAERARIRLAEEPERQRRRAEAEAERLARLATCPCIDQLPEDAARGRYYPAASNCTNCDSWLCASCDRVRVTDEGDQCSTCRPDSTTATEARGAVEDGPHYRITVPSLECFDEAMCWLIRAGARNAGGYRMFAVHLPVCTSQAEALEELRAFGSGSDRGKIRVELVPDNAQVAVDPELPEPDLSGLGNVDAWCAHGYPALDKTRTP